LRLPWWTDAGNSQRNTPGRKAGGVFLPVPVLQQVLKLAGSGVGRLSAAVGKEVCDSISLRRRRAGVNGCPKVAIRPAIPWRISFAAPPQGLRLHPSQPLFFPRLANRFPTLLRHCSHHLRQGSRSPKNSFFSGKIGIFQRG